MGHLWYDSDCQKPITAKEISTCVSRSSFRPSTSCGVHSYQFAQLLKIRVMHQGPWGSSFQPPRLFDDALLHTTAPLGLNQLAHYWLRSSGVLLLSDFHLCKLREVMRSSRKKLVERKSHSSSKSMFGFIQILLGFVLLVIFAVFLIALFTSRTLQKTLSQLQHPESRSL